MKGGDLKAKLDTLANMQDMLDDRMLTGDLLILALSFLDCWHRTGKANTKEISARTGWDIYHIKRVIAKDIPRYEPPASSWACTVPLVRKEGVCGQSAGNHHRIRNPETGEYEDRRTCSRHEPGMAAMERAKKIEWAANGAPEPANNAGGVLTRYFHTDELYDWATPEWKKGADRTPPIPRPKLKAIREAAPELTAPVRPALGVIKGAKV